MAALEVLGADWNDIDRRQIAELRLMTARLVWKQKKLIRSFDAACHDVITTPIVARDFRALVQRDLAEQHCTAGEYIKAKQSHRFLLQARPYDRDTSTKYL